MQLAVVMLVLLSGCAGPHHDWGRAYGTAGGHAAFAKDRSIAGARFLAGYMVGRAFTTASDRRRLASGPYAAVATEMTLDGGVLRRTVHDDKDMITLGAGLELGFAIATYDPEAVAIAPATQLFVRAMPFTGLREGIRIATGISAPALPRAAARLVGPAISGTDVASSVSLFVLWIIPVIAISNAELVVEASRGEPARIGFATGLAF